MDQNRIFSGEAYKVENGKMKINEHSEDSNYLILDTIDSNKDKIGNEQMPKKNSMQAIAVAEIKDEFKSYDIDDLKDFKGFPESVVKKDITIAYAGTKGWQDMKTDVREIARNDKHTNGAFQSALSYAGQIEQRFPKETGYTIATTGHSLGGAEAIYVAVLKGYDALTYGAAGSGLSDDELKRYTGQIVNLYDTSDIVTSGLLTGGQKKIPFLSIGIDNAGWGTLGHSKDQFNIDKHGNYIDKYGDIAVYSNLNDQVSIEQTLLAQSILANKEEMRQLENYDLEKKRKGKKEYQRLKEENSWLQMQIDSFKTLNVVHKKLKASGGGISANEQIYLEDSQALTLVKLASSKFDLAMENVRKLYNEGIIELEGLWHEGVVALQGITPDLSYNELIDTLSLVGCTKQNIVIIPTEELQDKLNRAQQMSNQFTILAMEITNKIKQLAQQDKELANQLF